MKVNDPIHFEILNKKHTSTTEESIVMMTSMLHNYQYYKYFLQIVGLLRVEKCSFHLVQ